MAEQNKAEAAENKRRAERHSRSVMLHGYGGAALRIFGTYTVDDDGKPRKIVVRAFHRDSAAAPWNPGATSTPATVEDLEDEVADLELRATAIGWKRLARRKLRDAFTADQLPVPPGPPDAKMRKRDAFTAGGIPEPLSVKHGGGAVARSKRGR
jgi:hypothetical protein